MSVDPNPIVYLFEVPGPFAPKGSTVSFVDRRGVVVTKTDSVHGIPFAQAIQWAARQAGVVCVPPGVGVSLSVAFRFVRPKGCPKDRRVPCVRPDVDKLLRAVGDALIGIAYQDDGQISTISASKRYADRTVALIQITVDPT